jgi:hypothetical protein
LRIYLIYKITSNFAAATAAVHGLFKQITSSSRNRTV